MATAVIFSLIAMPLNQRNAIMETTATDFLDNPAVKQSTESLPGVDGFDEELLNKLNKAKLERGSVYKPRTKHLASDGRAKYTNRLFLESSPYLLQHAHNPVNWYSWGDEAFKAAEKLNRPVLVSIGYSTCHWCHVMEEESFEDEEIARYLNENYIAVKVDREERPDIDAIYMTAVQAMTGQGGWPLNVWLTPDRKPFYGGTYFPARDGDRGAATGFLTLLEKINAIYHTQNQKVVQSSLMLTELIQKNLATGKGIELPGADVLHNAADLYKDRFDAANGGVKGAPKFPSSLPVRFLLRYHRRTGDTKFLDMADITLEKMAAGGMYDHVGGGFHRYSTDQEWLVPHFEKMLYDNALLVMAYLEGYQATGKIRFKEVAVDILNYVGREMTSSEGAFYSATDADSLTPEGLREEGYFFTWTPGEIDIVLNKEQARIVKGYYSIGPVPNFEGRYILNTTHTDASVIDKLNMSEDELTSVLAASKKLLYHARKKRPAPLRDDKILTAWNGLMISAYARAGLVLGESMYTDRAEKAARFILNYLFVNNRLFRSFSGGKARYNAYLDDYAFFIAALLDLYETSHDLFWLKTAIQFDDILADLYEDKINGGFFMTSKDHENLIAREKPNYDGAVPSGNSIAVLNLLRLNELTSRKTYRLRAEIALKAFLGASEVNPLAYSEMLLALDFYLDKPKEIIIITPDGEASSAGPFVSALGPVFLPNRFLAVAGQGDSAHNLADLIPAVRGKTALEGKTTAYVCENGTCRLPVTDPEAFVRQIRARD